MRKRLLFPSLFIIVLLVLVGVGVVSAAVLLGGGGNARNVNPQGLNESDSARSNAQKGILGEGNNPGSAIDSSLWGALNAITPPAFFSGVTAPTRFLYLASWEWINEGPFLSAWQCPGGDCIGLVDLRSLPQQGKAGGKPEGYGFFVYDKEKNIPNSIFLGNNLYGVLQNKTKIQTALGLTLDSNTPLDALWEMLTSKADITGETFAGPLMPTTELNLELHLGGYSLVKSEKFNKDKHVFVLNALKNNYRKIRQISQERGSDIYKKVLDLWEEKYGIDYRNFIPSDLPDEGKLPHQTTYTDDFNRVDSDTLGSGWTEDSGDIDIVSNRAAFTDSALAGSRGRYTVLSSDDHYAQASITTVALPLASSNMSGVAVRMENVTQFDSYTWHYIITLTPTYSRRMRKIVNGTGTNLINAAGVQTLPITMRLEVAGSSLKGYTNGVQTESNVTDTGITGNLSAGIFGNAQTGDLVDLDNWEAGDLTTMDFQGVDIEGIDIPSNP